MSIFIVTTELGDGVEIYGVYSTLKNCEVFFGEEDAGKYNFEEWDVDAFVKEKREGNSQWRVTLEIETGKITEARPVNSPLLFHEAEWTSGFSKTGNLCRVFSVHARNKDEAVAVAQKRLEVTKNE